MKLFLVFIKRFYAKLGPLSSSYRLASSLIPVTLKNFFFTMFRILALPGVKSLLRALLCSIDLGLGSTLCPALWQLISLALEDEELFPLPEEEGKEEKAGAKSKSSSFLPSLDNVLNTTLLWSGTFIVVQYATGAPLVAYMIPVSCFLGAAYMKLMESL